jgi:hypothetical protein
MVNYIAKNKIELDKIIKDLPETMALNISKRLNIPASNVGGLRKLTSLPFPLRLEVPIPRYPESAVWIERPN